MTETLPDEDAAPEQAIQTHPVRIVVPAWGIAAIVLAVLASAILPPVAEEGLVALLDDREQGVDPIVTGTATVPQHRYTVHRSVLHPAGEICTVFANGRTHGAC